MAETVDRHSGNGIKWLTMFGSPPDARQLAITSSTNFLSRSLLGMARHVEPGEDA